MCAEFRGSGWAEERKVPLLPKSCPIPQSWRDEGPLSGTRGGRGRKPCGWRHLERPARSSGTPEVGAEGAKAPSQKPAGGAVPGVKQEPCPRPWPEWQLLLRGTFPKTASIVRAFPWALFSVTCLSPSH